jgi:hypothetical protein
MVAEMVEGSMVFWFLYHPHSSLYETHTRVKAFFFLFSTLEDGTDKLSKIFGKKLQLLATQQTSRAQFSCTLSRKPEITLGTHLWEGYPTSRNTLNQESQTPFLAILRPAV